MFEDTKGVIRNRISKTDRQHKGKRTKFAPEGLAVPAPHVTPIDTNEERDGQTYKCISYCNFIWILEYNFPCL